jgi:hypothetical protein
LRRGMWKVEMARGAAADLYLYGSDGLHEALLATCPHTGEVLAKPAVALQYKHQQFHLNVICSSSERAWGLNSMERTSIRKGFDLL